MPVLHQGSWFGLPDFGITEAIGRAVNRPTSSQGGSNLIGPSNAQTPTTSAPLQYGPTYGGPQGQVQGVTRSITGGGGGAAPAYNSAPQMGQVQNQLNSGLDMVDREYQNFLTQLSGQEEALRAQEPISRQKVEAGYAPAVTAVKEQQAGKLAGLAGQESLVSQQKTSQMQQARDLFRQMQQQNIAQLSGMGISSSSVAEALAENLGVETARRIASTAQSADDVFRQINQERVNVNDFAQRKLTDIETQKAAALADIQNQFVQGLNQINQARQIAANDKANRRQDLLSQAQAAAAQIEQQAQNFAQSLQMWQAQTQQGLANAANQDFGAMFGQIQSAIPQIRNLAAGLGQAGMAPQFDFGSNGVRVSVGQRRQEDPEGEAF